MDLVKFWRIVFSNTPLGILIYLFLTGTLVWKIHTMIEFSGYEFLLIALIVFGARNVGRICFKCDISESKPTTQSTEE